MDDEVLASRAAGGDLDAFGELYDRYFQRVYDFSWRALRDRALADEAVRETFSQAAQALPSASHGGTFASWLFRIAHASVLARAAAGAGTGAEAAHEEAFGTFDVPDASRLDDPAVVSGDTELAPLVWEAASALSTADYAVLDLHLRQGLDAEAVGHVAGVSRRNAANMLERLRTAASNAIATYVVARRCSEDCPELRSALAATGFPRHGDDVRSAVQAHLGSCESCDRAYRNLPPVLAVLAALASVPAPLALKGDVWRDLAAGWDGRPADDGGAAAFASDGSAASTSALATGGDDGGRRFDSFTAVPGDGEGGNRIVLFAVGVLGLMIFAFAIAGGVIIAGGLDDDNGGGLDSATQTPTAEPEGSRTPPGVIVETPTIDLTPSITPLPEDTATPLPDTATPLPPPPPTDTPVPVEPTEAPPTEPPADDETPTPDPDDEQPTETPDN